MLNGCGPYGHLKLCCPLLVAACVPHSCGLYRSCLLTLMVTPPSTVCLILKQPLLTTPQLSAQGGQNIWKYLQKFYRLNCSQQPDLVSSAVEKSGHITRMPPVIVTPHTSAPAATAGAIMGNWTDKTGAVLSWLLPTAVAGQLKIMQKWVVRVCPRPRCKL